jgi:hypothetical protein
VFLNESTTSIVKNERPQATDHCRCRFDDVPTVCRNDTPTERRAHDAHIAADPDNVCCDGVATPKDELQGRFFFSPAYLERHGSNLGYNTKHFEDQRRWVWVPKHQWSLGMHRAVATFANNADIPKSLSRRESILLIVIILAFMIAIDIFLALVWRKV